MTQIPPTAPIKAERPNEFTIKSQKALIETYAWQCCLNCEEYSKKHIEKVLDETKYSGWRDEDMGPRCMKYEQLPPPEVLVNGCEEWIPVIPF